MEVKDEQYTFNFADKSSEDRMAELKNLIAIKEYLMGMKENNDLDNNYSEDGNSRGSRAHQKVLSTKVGKSLSDNNQQSGFSSAFMLGILSFVFEILFLALSIFVYK